MLKEGGFSKMRALRVLDHAVSGNTSSAVEVCAKIIDAAGLKTIFGLLMKKPDTTTCEHTLGILSALLRLLPGQSTERIRTLAKFAEKGYEKTIKLVQLRQDYARRVKSVDDELALEQRMLDEEEREERADEFFSRRLDGGLFGLQTTDIILAWLVAEEVEAKKVIASQLEAGGDSLADIGSSLQEQLDGLNLNSADDEDTKDMLTTLLSFLA